MGSRVTSILCGPGTPVVNLLFEVLLLGGLDGYWHIVRSWRPRCSISPLRRSFLPSFWVGLRVPGILCGPGVPLVIFLLGRSFWVGLVVPGILCGPGVPVVILHLEAYLLGGFMDAWHIVGSWRPGG